MTPPVRSRAISRGFTLMEILLVLAIVVAVMAMAAPAFTGAIENQRLRNAADIVRTQFARAHVKAMKTGRIQVFRYEVGGTEFRLEPWVAGDDTLEAAQNTGFGPVQPQPTVAETQPGAEEGTATTDLRRQLPGDIIFVGGDAAAESRSLEIEANMQGVSSGAAEWSRPIMFYPDGATSDAYVIVASPRAAGIRVDLRGMTGTATVGDISPLSDLVE